MTIRTNDAQGRAASISKNRIGALLAATALTGSLMGLPAYGANLLVAPGATQTDDTGQSYDGIIVGSGGGTGTATYNVTTTDGVTAGQGGITIGADSAGEVNVTSGGLLITSRDLPFVPSHVYVGKGTSNGTLNISGADMNGTQLSTVQIDGDLRIANDSANADVTVENGGQLNVGATITVGNTDNYTGTLNIGKDGLVEADNVTIAAAGYVSKGWISVHDGGELLSHNVIRVNGTDNAAYGALFVGGTTVGNAEAAGNISAGIGVLLAGSGKLIFNHTDSDYTFDSDVQGTGDIYFQAGTTRLTGSFTSGDAGFTGNAYLNGGKLLVNTQFNPTLDVQSGATLGGVGSVAQATILDGGTLAPGDDTIQDLGFGHLQFNTGSTYVVRVNDGGNEAGVNNDLAYASSGIVIEGGTVHVTPENGTDDGSTYTLGTQYTILQSNAVEGTFDTVTDDFAFLDGELSYDATNVYLTLNEAAGDSGVFSTVATTPNQQATAGALNGLGSGNAVYDALILSTNEDDARDAMDQLSGDGHASAAAAGISDTRFLRQASLNRLRVTGQGGQQAQGGEVMSSMGSDNSLPISVWGTGYGEWQRLNNDGNNAGILTRMSAGLYIGGDMQLGNGLTFGVLGGIGHSSDSIASRNMTGSSTSYELGVYGGGSFGNVDVSFGAGQTWYDIATERNVAFGGFTDTLSASYKARATQVFGEVGYRFDLKDVTIEPFAGAALVHMSTDAFSETGGAAALSSAASSSNTGFTTLGLRGETDMPGMDGVTLTGSLAWRHAFGSTSSASTMTLNGGAGAFAVSGDTIGRDTALFDLGADFALNDSSTLNVSYSGEFGAGIQKHGLSAQFEMKF